MRFALLSFVLLAACGGTNQGEPGPDGGSGAVCGGLGNQACPADEFCDFDRNGCGAADETGTCRPRPTACDDNSDPVCGCDGEIHGNPCDAAAAGTDLNAFGTCALEPGAFTCGFRACDLATSYCQHAASDIGSEPDQFTCVPLPACAGEPSCGCLQDQGEPCADTCDGDAASGLTTTCLGG